MANNTNNTLSVNTFIKLLNNCVPNATFSTGYTPGKQGYKQFVVYMNGNPVYSFPVSKNGTVTGVPINTASSIAFKYNPNTQVIRSAINNTLTSNSTKLTASDKAALNNFYSAISRTPEELAMSKNYTDNHLTDEQLIQKLLNKYTTTAKQNYNLTKEDYENIKVALPDLSTQQITSLIKNSGWAQNILDGVDTELGNDTIQGLALEDYMSYADDANEAQGDIAKSKIQKQRDALLTQIKNDPELYKNIMTQFHKDTNEGVVTGKRAANVKDVAGEANKSYTEAADTLYSELSKLPEEQRTAVYENLLGGLSGYTSQQINAMNNQANADANAITNLISVLKLADQGIQSENAMAARALQDAIDRSTNYANLKGAEYEAKGNSSSAGSDAKLQTLLNATDTIAGIQSTNKANEGKEGYKPIPISAVTLTAPNYGSGTIVKPELLNPEDYYISEELYQRLIDNGLGDYLTQEAFDKYTTAPTQEELAKQYGLEYLLSPSATQDIITGYATDANEQSNRAFNDAQRAYISALAAGDVKTANQLTKMAQTAGASKQNVYGSAALAGSFAQQQKNAAVGNNLQQDYITQRANNNLQIANAKRQGAELWNSWVGSGADNENSFNRAYNKFGSNAAQSRDAYTGLYTRGMQSESNFNDLISQGVRTTNTNLSNLAARLTAINSNNAASNTRNASTIAGLKDRLNNNPDVLQELINRGL